MPGTEVDDIAFEIACVNLGGVSPDKSPALSTTLVTDTKADERKKNDMAQNMVLRSPAS